MTIHQDFAQGIDPHWQQYVVGTGRLEPTDSTLRFVVRPDGDGTARTYSNAQIDDYQGLPRRRFPWRPPLRLSVRARFSHPARDGSGTGDGLRGTAGFGFWNDPFLMTGARVPTLPRAIWFFYSSLPSNMKLDLQTPGYGWKAATIDALRPGAMLLVPSAPLAVLLMNVHPLYRALWPSIQRMLHVQEATVGAPDARTDAADVDRGRSSRRSETTSALSAMTEWHTYVIDWGTDHAYFTVDGTSVLKGAPSPRGPLGFVMWLDNQYMVATPWGRLGWGLLDVPDRQWMEVDWLAIESGTSRGDATFDIPPHL